jgi:hypothetical protein
MAQLGAPGCKAAERNQEYWIVAVDPAMAGVVATGAPEEMAVMGETVVMVALWFCDAPFLVNLSLLQM